MRKRLIRGRSSSSDSGVELRSLNRRFDRRGGGQIEQRADDEDQNSENENLYEEVTENFAHVYLNVQPDNSQYYNLFYQL